MMKIMLIILPDPLGTHVFRFNSAGFGSSIALPNPKYKYDVFPPIFESYAAALLENQGHEVRILDCQSPNIAIEEILKEIEKQKPTIIVSGICLPSYYNDLEIIAKIKATYPAVILVGWGGLCKNSPQEILEQSKLDAILRMVELEEILPDFVKAVEENKIESVAGLSFKKTGKIYHNVDRAFNANLDAIPIPAYHLLGMKKYVALEAHYIRGGSSNKYIQFFSLSASRGCSFNCVYCPYPINYGPWRCRSPEKIVDEIEVLVKKIQQIRFILLEGGLLRTNFTIFLLDVMQWKHRIRYS